MKLRYLYTENRGVVLQYFDPNDNRKKWQDIPFEYENDAVKASHEAQQKIYEEISKANKAFAAKDDSSKSINSHVWDDEDRCIKCGAKDWMEAKCNG